MGDSFHIPSRRDSKIIGVISSEKMSEGYMHSSLSKPSEHKSFKKLVSFDHGKILKGTSYHLALFLLKIAALDTVRRFSLARCPFVWPGIQALQVLHYPPFKWLQRWKPFRVLSKSMQNLSRPLLVLSLVTAFSDKPDSCDDTSDDTENSSSPGDCLTLPESQLECPASVSRSDSSICEEVQSKTSKDWLLQLYAELEKQQINLPERINEDELNMFYSAANGNLSQLVASIKKTIHWRESYRILSEIELETWSNMIFWHGFDVNLRPCLIVRLGLACMSLPYDDRPRFTQAVVSQVERGILHFINCENPQITVLVDCEGLTPLRVPMKMMRSCSNLLQDHFPNRLACLLVIRIPPVVRVVAQTFIQVLKPATRKKLKIVGEMYHNVLSEYLQTIPSYLGGVCVCSRCEILGTTVRQPSFVEGRVRTTEGTNIDANYASQIFIPMDGRCDQVLRSAIVGFLILWALVAFLAGIYDPASRPFISS